MDFLNPKKKRAHRIRLLIGYSLMAVALAIGTLILVFAAYGYGIDRHTGDVIQNGLVIVDAHPEAATILVNGVNKGSTNQRLFLPAGKYTVQLNRSGYRSWQHDVTLEGSSIEQLVYPVLFPQKLVTKALKTYDTLPPLASGSPDRHWLVVEAPTVGSFDVTDLNNARNAQTTISLPADTLTKATGSHTFEAIEWATDNVHLLLKHSFTGGSEFIMLDRDNPAASVNLNKLFPAASFTTVSLRDKKSDQLYLYNAADATLMTADMGNRTTAPLLGRVIAYKSYQANTVLYTTNPTNNNTGVEVHLHQNDQDYLLRTLPIAQTPYLLDMADFNGHFYLVAGSPADGRVYVYKDPMDDLTRHPARTPQPFRVLIVNGATNVSFSAIARFIAVQGGSHFAVYDAETGRQFRYDINLPLPASEKATWMDGHRLVLVSDNLVNIFDFDGTNLQKLSASRPELPPFFDRDYKAMFTLAPDNNPAKTDVLRTELKVLPPGATP